MNQWKTFGVYCNAWLCAFYLRDIALSLALVFLGTVFCRDANAAELKPGQELSVVFNIDGKRIPIIFRFCPPGQIVPGEPKQDDNSTGPAAAGTGIDLLGGPKKISAFYLSETEITVAQYAQTVGTERFQKLTARAAKMKGAKEDLALLTMDHDKHPIFMVGPLEAITFCNALNEAQASGTGQGRSAIERWNFRLPSHIEWQYACRGVSDANSENKNPHFHSWADFDALDKNDRAKCLEEWKEMSRPEAEFNGTQFQIAEIIAKRYSTANSKPLEILTVFLKQGIRSHRDFSKPATAPIATIQSTGPNAWGLFDMHDNVREWTIAVEDRGELQRLWRELDGGKPISDENRQRKILFLAGGAANDTMAGGAEAAWKAFAIWGGRPMDMKSGTPEYFSFADDEDHDNEKTFDYAPGLRVLLERVLADDWLLVVRRETVLSKDNPAPALASIDNYQQVIREITPDSEQKEKEAVLSYYAGLAQYRLGKISEATSILDAHKANLVPTRKKKIDLSSIDVLGTEPSASTKPLKSSAGQSEDATYFGLLAELLKRDQEISN